MYEYISGTLATLTPATAVVDNGGIGYILQITLNTYTAIQQEKQVKLWVHQVIREDAHLLYGFHTMREREMFRLLLAVNGVGAATARIMLSSITVDQLTAAIASQDAKTVQRIKGIGPKTAQRIVLELHDKVASDGEGIAVAMPATNRDKEEALGALVMLGFPKAAAEKVLLSLDGELSVEELVKQSLKRL